MAHEKATAIILCVIMVFGAGCAGWGTDGPADDTNDDVENDTGENVDSDESTNDEDDSSSQPVDDSDGESENDGTDPPDSSDDESSSSDGGEDESTDETGETGDGDSDDSQDDSDESDGEDSDEDDSSSDDSQDDSETSSLTVTVYDSEGNPVEGADVSLAVHDTGAGVDNGDATTDKNGQATFEVPDGDYEVLVDGTEDEQSSTNAGVTVNGDTEYTVNLIDPSDDMHSYSATVQVVDEEGNPISNERVEVSSPPGEEPTEYLTDENGEFTIEFQNSSETDVVQHEVVARETAKTIHVERGVQHEQITVSMENERQTHPLVVNSGELYPVEGVEVTIERHADGATTTKTTNEDGEATFDVYPGDYTVTGVDEQGEELSQEVTVDGHTSVMLAHEVPTPEEVQTTVTVVDQDGNPVEDVTVEARTGLPPDGADVYLQSDATDENGEVQVQVYEDQTYGSVVVQDADGNQYDHGGETFTTDGDGVTIEVERPSDSPETTQSLAVGA